MTNNKLLDIQLQSDSKQLILEKIKKYTSTPSGFLHIVSLNPENLVVSLSDSEYKRALARAQIRINDGVGIVVAGRILGLGTSLRVTGTELMADMLRMANSLRLRGLFLGGKPNLANRLSDCYSQLYPEAKFMGIEGIKNIKSPLPDEEKRIFTIVAEYKPHIIFASFGSPDQELWLDRHSKRFTGIIGMGVGGAFDYLDGHVVRAPGFLQKIGLEWLFRLVVQPWRWRRQLRLIKFAWIVIKEKFKN